MTQPPWNQPWGRPGPPPNQPQNQPPYQPQGYPPGYPPQQQPPPPQQFSPQPQGPPPQGPPPQGPPPWQPHPAGPAPAPAPRAGRRAGGRGVLGLVAGAVVLLAVGGVAGYLVGQSSTTDVLNRNSVASGVQHVLQDDYGVSNVTDLSCPDDMEVKMHATYTCTFTAGSAHATVDIVIQNDAGQYVVQGPKG